MKKIIYTIAALFVLGGCNWMDVSSSFEVREDDLFDTEEGFKSSLTGVYIKIASKEAYGMYATMVIPEFITRHWGLIDPPDETSADYGLFYHNYTADKTEELFKDMWEQYYNAIVQLNNVLENLKDTRVDFSYGNRELIEGEALGLRAALHFEMLRFFGPVPARAGAGTKTVPYMEVVTNNPNLAQPLSWAEIREKILRDLDTAEKLLSGDPFIKAKISEVNQWDTGSSYTPQDEWHLYRQTRFNYYAVQATKARVYLWFGDEENAVLYARKVIDATNGDGSKKFELATQSYLNGDLEEYKGNGRSLIFECEGIFQVHNSKLQSVIETGYKSYRPRFYQTASRYSSAFETTANINDMRAGNSNPPYWSSVTVSGASTMHYYKYTGNSNISPNNRVPVIRLAELYMILIECLPNGQANEVMEQFRTARNMARNYIEQPFSEIEKFGILDKEYRKDFWAEGQLFHFYKRHNVTSFSYPSAYPVSSAIYELPIPRGQIEFQ